MSRRCFSDHMGAWAIEPRWLSQALAAIQGGAWAPGAAADVRPVLRHELEGTEVAGFAAVPGSGQLGPAPSGSSYRVWMPNAVWPNGDRPDVHAAGGSSDAERPSFTLLSNGIALVSIAGPMMKQRSKFGGTSTIEVRRALRDAAASRDVRGILLHVDSPGGHVAGTYELAQDVAAARRRKPLHAYVEDLGASAAYWAASQAGRVSVNPTGQVGSIGTVAVLFDESQRFEANGVRTVVVSTGKLKGAGAPGAPITEEHVEHVRELVEDFNGHFLAAVRRGRQLGQRKLEAVSDGRTFIGRKALDAGLVDAVEGIDEAIAKLSEAADARSSRGAAPAAAWAGAAPSSGVDLAAGPDWTAGHVLADEAARQLEEEEAAQEAAQEAEAAEALEHRRKAAELRRRRLELES